MLSLFWEETMKKQLIIVGIILMLLTVGLSGCNEETENNDDTKEANAHEGKEQVEMDIEYGDCGAFVVNLDNMSYIKAYANVKNNENVTTPRRFWVEFYITQSECDYEFRAKDYLLPNEWTNLTANIELQCDGDIFLSAVTYDEPLIWKKIEQ